mmetsp:Transcript_30651/g.64873  ORF Transcript_30651/g.64873 Transcript_30651/m.64873 type:complete len:632 (+) Transcript_30651:130-2025(+)
MENLLSQAAAELTIRSAVETTLTLLLQDVEHAHALEQSLRAHNKLHQCREQLAALTVRYEDREAAWEADRREKERLGTLLLEEIVKLSAREVKGEESKREMELRLRELEDGERSVAVVQQQQQQNNEQNVPAGGEKKEEGGMKQNDASQTADMNEDGQRKVSEAADGNIPIDPEEKKQIISDTTNNATDAKAAEGSNASGSPTKVPDETGTVTEESKEPNDSQSFAPHKLDETTLMNIFAYLDPLDVMNFAQINKALLSKVNVMFGMGGEESDADQQQQQQSGCGEDAAAPSVKEQTEPPPPTQPTAMAAASATSSNTGQTVSSSASVTEATNTITSAAATKSSSHKRQGSGTSVATAGTTGSGGTANPFSQVSSWFGAGSTTDTSSTTSAPTAVGNSATSTNSAAAPIADAGSSEIKLNAAMATSMASKLTPAELSIILRMREKLHKCEADANKWRLEKEDAVTNLASVEAVKEFLVARVRDTERVVQMQKEDMRQVEKKNLEDQEVIVFLDERVKELEKGVDEMKSKEATTIKESMDIVNKNEKKARVLSDMLRFEREQMAANEKEWKTAKKVLVKEVKSCRGRIVALEAELEGCRQQNEQLKQGLMGLTQPSGMSPGGKKSLRSIGRH